MTSLIGLSSSLRTRPPSETLKLACAISRSLGITRVVDTTWLDKVGVPVFSSIRPSAQKNSLCVNAGKGLRPLEAKVGAYMEAIEFALAEFNEARDRHHLISITPRELNELYSPSFKFVDFCPSYNRSVDPDSPIYAIEAEDVLNGGKVYVPAELVFHPFNENDQAAIFGTSTNGLSSGNSLQEAIIHGVFEVMERDIQAFDFIEDKSYLISQNSWIFDLAKLEMRNT